MSDLFIDRGAVLSDDSVFRLSLWRVWDRSLGMAAWLMLNPSDGDADRNDPSILRCFHFSRAWGLGGFTIGNVYPYRSPSPAACRRWAMRDGRIRDGEIPAVLRQNLEIIGTQARAATLRVVAFGGGAWDRDWAEVCLDAFSRPSGDGKPVSLYCLGFTADGSPKHPMARGVHRVPDDQKPILWRAMLG